MAEEAHCQWRRLREKKKGSREGIEIAKRRVCLCERERGGGGREGTLLAGGVRERKKRRQWKHL